MSQLRFFLPRWNFTNHWKTFFSWLVASSSSSPCLGQKKKKYRLSSRYKEILRRKICIFLSFHAFMHRDFETFFSDFLPPFQCSKKTESRISFSLTLNAGKLGMPRAKEIFFFGPLLQPEQNWMILAKRNESSGNAAKWGFICICRCFWGAWEKRKRSREGGGDKDKGGNNSS